MKILKYLPVLSTLFTLGLTGPSLASADEHLPSTIQGEGIQFYEKDHAFAGSINGAPAFGAFEHDPFGGQLFLRKGEKTITLQLGYQEDVYKGLIEEKDSGGALISTTSVSLVGIKKTGQASAIITLNLNGAEVPVTVTGEKFEAGHFEKPHFEAQLAGKTVSFQFTGKSCFGYSSNIAMLIFAGYSHLSQ